MKRNAWSKIVLAVAVSGMIPLLASECPAGTNCSTQTPNMFIQRLDTNGDGKVSKEEFLASFNKLDKNGDGYIEESEAPKGPPHRFGKKKGDFIKNFDKNGDGKVSRAEFPGPDNAFNRLDKNGDGFIEESEVPEGPPHHFGRDGGDFIKDCDKNGDGKVSREEFPGPDQAFNRLDKNGDGFIEQSEVPQRPAM